MWFAQRAIQIGQAEWLQSLGQVGQILISAYEQARRHQKILPLVTASLPLGLIANVVKQSHLFNEQLSRHLGLAGRLPHKRRSQ